MEQRTKYKILIISDTHEQHEELEKIFKLPEADFLIHCGDITGLGSEYKTRNFLEWFGKLNQYPFKIFIAGNHDFLFEEYPIIARDLVNEYKNKYSKNGEIIYLEDSGVNLWGLNFWGIPVTQPFNNWAFNRPEVRLKQHWDAVPLNTDVLITHGPPRKIMDYSTFGNEYTGSLSLRFKVLNRIKPLIHCFGHIHSNYGQEEHNGIKFINASVLDDSYNISHPPVLVEIEK